MRERRILLSSVACLAVPCLSTLSHKRHEFQRKSSKVKCVFWFPLQISFAIFLIIRRIKRDMIKKCILKGAKCTPVQALRLCTGRTVHRVSRIIALPFLYHGTRKGWGVCVTPRPLFTRYPLYRRLGGSQGWSGQVRKISPPPRFDPRIVQPVASRYTDWATRPTKMYIGLYVKYPSFLSHLNKTWIFSTVSRKK